MPRADLIKSDAKDHSTFLSDNFSEDGRIIWTPVLIVIYPLSKNIRNQFQISGFNPFQSKNLDPKYGHGFVDQRGFLVLGWQFNIG